MSGEDTQRQLQAFDAFVDAPAPAEDEPEVVVCHLAEGCGWEGSWPDYLQHALRHPLPDQADRPSWLEARRTFLGASEVGGVVGVNPYQTALDVWATKVLGVRELEDDRHTRRLGHLLEPVLLLDYAERHGVALQRPATMRHRESPWAAATPDGISSSGELVQVKLVGARMLHHWKEGPPRYVLAQVQWEMWVWERTRCVVLAGLGGTDIEEYPVERDEEMVDYLAVLGEAFWQDTVVAGALPDVFDGVVRNETLAALYPKATRQMAPAPEGLPELAAAYADARDMERQAKEQKERIGQTLQLMIGDRAGFEWRGGRATWNNIAGSVEWERLALDLGERLGLDVGAFRELMKKHTPVDGGRRLQVSIKGR